jgi:hypothetical protein
MQTRGALEKQGSCHPISMRTYDLDVAEREVEMVLWRVPRHVPPSTRGLKYSLFYGRWGIRETGYDNERGKGDHRHFKGVETAYAFSTVEQLMADFWSDVRTLRGGK